MTGLSCTTCHGGYDAAHPDPAAVMPPTVALSAQPLLVKFGLTTILSGSVKTGTTGVAGKTVTLQRKPADSTAFMTIVKTTTGADGGYSFLALSPTMLTTYRVVTYGGVVGATTVKPSLKLLDVEVKPDLTLALSKTRFLLGGSLAIKGTLNPARTGGIVKLTIQKKVGTSWKTKLTKSVALTAGSGYTPTPSPTSRRSWRRRAAAGVSRRRSPRRPSSPPSRPRQDLDREVGAFQEHTARKGLGRRCGRAARERGPSFSDLTAWRPAISFGRRWDRRLAEYAGRRKRRRRGRLRVGNRSGVEACEEPRRSHRISPSRGDRMEPAGVHT